MLFKVSQISATVELVFDNAEKLINVYPAYHQVGNLIYQNIDSDKWTVLGGQYVWEINTFGVSNDTIPAIQLIYSNNTTSTDKQRQYQAFSSISAVETIPGKIRLYSPYKPAVSFRIRYRILNKLDLAIPLNRYYAVGLGFTSESGRMYAQLTGYNPVANSNVVLSTIIPEGDIGTPGIMPPDIMARLEKMEAFYNTTMTQSYCIEGYASEADEEPTTTYYASWSDYKTIPANTWYKECSVRTRTDAKDFTTAERLVYQQQTTVLNLTHVYTGNVKTFKRALAANAKLQKIIGLELLDTRNVTDMSYMFQNDVALTAIDLSSWDTTNVQNITGLFSGCTHLKSIDMRSFDFIKIRATGASADGPLIDQPDIFKNVPDNCAIWVSGSEQRDAVLSKYPNLTNVTYN